ncbi:hypothetical protein QNI16_38560 [Cytophagaceae bacterium YF14B1]|uniref:Uncharacterized protein n=1 Tax=Xanthocytophaga flava TaxID=3048013 RepID=A0AAE3QZK7_9BACT|nr:hypothetical protein [Xanthocytophaga flavus]MDJ1486440.1 hypothetical protein [Xanthocytophaga flavus]
MLAYRRNDGGTYPEEFNVTDTKALQIRGLAAYKLLEKFSQILGRNHLGELDANNIEKWVQQVRVGCNDIGSTEVCDLAVEKLFSNASVDENSGRLCPTGMHWKGL